MFYQIQEQEHLPTDRKQPTKLQDCSMKTITWALSQYNLFAALEENTCDPEDGSCRTSPIGENANSSCLSLDTWTEGEGVPGDGGGYNSYMACQGDFV